MKNNKIQNINQYNKTYFITVLILLAISKISYSAMPVVPVPNENPITENKRILGKILFWDEQLSSDNTMACGTCHIISNGGTDPRPATNPGPDMIFGTQDDVIGSLGIVNYDENMQLVEHIEYGFEPQVTDRNTPSFINAMYADDLFWDGRARSQFIDPQNPSITVINSGGGLESQAVGPILSHVEMAKQNRNWNEVIAKLYAVEPLALANDIPQEMIDAIRENNNYSQLFNLAFGDSNITAARIGMALATYERTLVSDQTPWDNYMAGDSTAMTADQIAGWELFNNGSMGMIRCSMCHQPPLFTDNKFYNIGLRPASEDIGRMQVTNNPDDFGRFKTPGLRNIGLKSAMMHVGWITDSMDSIDFYNALTNDQTSNHVQFTQDQSSLPVPNPRANPPYSRITIVPNSEAIQGQVADFMSNALTDPRVTNQAFPFDRPTLFSEKFSGKFINSGMNGSWYNPQTSGQGMIIEILPNIDKAFIAWFTYDNSLVTETSSTIGANGQRWLSGLGDIDRINNSITFHLKSTSGGIFDDNTAVSTTPIGDVGDATIDISDCTNATFSYDLYDGSLTNSFEIVKISSDSLDLCEKLALSKTLPKTEIGNFSVNAGLNGTWFNPQTNGQGFTIEVLPNSNKVFVAWFTYDSEIPNLTQPNTIGDISQRWLSGLGTIDNENNSVIIDLKVTSNGLFDNPTVITSSDPLSYGSLTLSFNDCKKASADYQIFDTNLSGTIPLIRTSNNNVALCEQLSNAIIQ